MQFDLTEMPPSERYRLMASVIAPRPIAWVTSQNEAGALNAAPFSFFNMMGDDPPTIVLGIMLRQGRLKDTANNIRTTEEFVVNLVGEPDAQVMNVTSVDAPSDVAETELAALPLLPSEKVRPSRIATAPVSFECRLNRLVEISAAQTIIIGEAVYGHLKDEFVLDRERLRIDTAKMQLIGRMHGAGWYTRTTDLFDMRRPPWPLP